MEKKTDLTFTAENEEIISYLKKSRLFSHMPDTQLERLSSYSDFIDYAPGDEIIREGEANNRIFFLIRGSLTVHAGG
ncbi:MAG: cyclic nucleotide-binding domain-containing protein, partial [Deltaproteobacteria bacterium]|nr:cyclic nucleotide-binding domain-containing protein [Deltaproteobacteria bacterium]